MNKIANFTAATRPSFGSVRYVKAPSPLDIKQQVVLEISPSVAKNFLDMGFQTQKMQIWSLLRGEAPPVNCIGRHEKGLPDIRPVGMKDAHALFIGIERPCNDYGDGDDVYVYVTAPTCTYEYIPDMVCVARRVPLENYLATIYVRMYTGWDKLPSDAPVGEIIGWDLILPEPKEAKMPQNYKQRYQKRIW